MMSLIRLAQATRRRYLPPDAAPIRAARAVARWSLARVYPQGVPIQIGTTGMFRIIPELAVGSFDYRSWGSGSNDGFHRWVECCRGKRVVVDIGAHVGLYALPASRVLAPGGRCYAIEPGDDNRAFLERHIAMNAVSNIEVISYLIGEDDRDGVPLFTHTRDGAMHSIVARSPEHGATVLKQQVCLDTLCATHGIVPEVLKIDVEGAELRVLEGAARVLRTTHPIIILSVHPRHLAALGHRCEELVAQIDALGYDVRDMRGAYPTTFSLSEYVLMPRVA